MDFITRRAGIHKALINLSSQQYFYKFFRVHSSNFVPYLFVLPSHPSFFCPDSPPYLLSSAPVFLSPSSPQDTLMLLLLCSSLSEHQLVFFFPSRPHSSSPFHRHTPHCQRRSSPGCLCECCLLSWHLESQIHIWNAKSWPNSTMWNRSHFQRISLANFNRPLPFF